MKATGFTKQIDPMGRLVIPKAVRNALGVSEEDKVEFFMGNDGEVILKRYESSCVFCGESDDVKDFMNKKVCQHCIEELKKM